ncbi:MAG TPA: RnfH family protein [Nitrosospira sp.]|jgi:putative ubiquitin-RnfH superfamily antitoxin RatB of RatAB toxin-antitoxin module|nr:RnfH family protein [Nitrosospira sp.]
MGVPDRNIDIGKFVQVPGENIDIEVVYALPEKQVVQRINLPEGTTAEQAVKMSGILRQFPEIDLLQNKLGIYGKLIKPATILRDRDRIEIYRPLRVDPKESRRRRAKNS